MTKTEIEALNLTSKQERFCEEYIIDLNGTKACVRAGYSEKTANRIASENLSKLVIQQYVQHLKAEIRKRNEIDADYLVKTLKNWVELDITDTMSLTVEELKKLPIELKRMITSFKKTDVVTEYGTTTNVELKFISREKAVEMLAKHIGFFDADNKIKFEGVKMPDIMIGLKVYDDSEED